MAGSRELRAMSLLAELRSRGFLVATEDGRLVIVPTRRLTELTDLAVGIEELLPELTALVNSGDANELIEAPAEIRDWLAAKHPTMRAAFYHAARLGAIGRSLHESMLGIYRATLADDAKETGT